MIDYLTAHFAELAGIASAFILFFDRLAKLTPSESDNKVIAVFYKIFAVLGVKIPDSK